VGIKTHFNATEVTSQYFSTLRTIKINPNSELFLLLKGTFEADISEPRNVLTSFNMAGLFLKRILSFKFKKNFFFCESRDVDVNCSTGLRNCGIDVAMNQTAQ
jgi:hypothetical protein